MEVAFILLYLVAFLCIIAFVGMGVMAFMDWRRDSSWKRNCRDTESNIIYKLTVPKSNSIKKL